jgi:hypothetical protein
MRLSFFPNKEASEGTYMEEPHRQKAKGSENVIEFSQTEKYRRRIITIISFADIDF